jgi:ATP-dependent Clp protease ATP-binding subunit ClpB
MLGQIVELQIKLLQKRLDEKQIKLKITPAAKKYLSQKGYDPAYGARPLKRIIQNEILDELSLLIIEGKIKAGSRVGVDIEKNKIIFKI